MSVRRWLTVVAAIALVFGGCGDEDEAQVFSPDELGAALLAPDDVGPGFAEDQRGAAEERPATTPPLDPGMWCEAAGDAGDRLLALAGEGVAFIEIVSTETAQRSFHGVSEQLWSAPVDDAAAFVDEAAAAIAVCAGESWIVEDGEGTASLAALAGEEVGDDSTMVLMTYVTPGPDGDHAWQGRTLVARFGATVMVLQELDVQVADSEPFFSDADWQRVTRTAADRVEALGS